MLEETSFLRRQAKHFDSFAESSRSLEELALPVAIELRDWRRFARHFVAARNLRDLPRAFGHPATMKAALAAGRSSFLLDTAERGGIHLRLVVRSHLVRKLEGGEGRFRELLEKIREDLRALPPPADEIDADAQFWALVVVATEAGPEVEAEIRNVLQAPGRQMWDDRLWVAMAAGCIDRDGLLADDVWRYFGEIQDEAVLASLLPDLFADEELKAPWEALVRVSDLSISDVRTVQLCWAAFLGRLAKSEHEAALFEWERLVPDSCEWSAELVERARHLFAVADVAWIERQMQSVEDPAIAAAVWVTAAWQGEARACAFAEDAIARLRGEERVHWSLRLLEGLPFHRHQRLQRIARNLQDMRFAVPAGDLCRFLELVAELFPQELERSLEDVVWTSGLAWEVLNELAEKSESRLLLECLSTHLETYVAALASSEVQGSWAFKQLAPAIAGRLCALRGDLAYLEPAVQLSPDKDEAHVTIAKALSTAGHLELTREVCERIVEKRLRLRTLLELVPGTAWGESLKDHAGLFSSLSTASDAEGVVLGLMSLAEVGRSLQSLQQLYLSGVEEENERALVWLRLVRTGLTCPHRSRWSARERRENAESLAQALSSLRSDAQLAFMTPDLLDVWRQIEPAGICDELRESLIQVLQLIDLSPDLRQQVVEILLSRMSALLFDPVAGDSVPPSRDREAASLLLWIAEQLERFPEVSNPENGIGLRPILIAAAGRLPEPALRLVRHGSRSGLLALLAASGQAEPAGETRSAVLACALVDGPREALRRLEEEPDPLASVGLIYLLAVQWPDLALEAIDSLRPNPSRDELCRRLICHGWLPVREAKQALELIQDPSLRLEADLYLGLRHGEKEDWIRRLAQLATEKDLDSSDPRRESLIRHLWSVASSESDAALAEAALTALVSGNTFRAQAAFHLWLHSLLGPRTDPSPEQLGLASDVLKMMTMALVLPAEARSAGGALF